VGCEATRMRWKMKRLIILIFCFGILFNTQVLSAERTVSKMLQDQLLINHPEKIEQAHSLNEKHIEERIEHTKNVAKLSYKMSQLDYLIRQTINNNTLVPEKGFCMYPLRTTSYSKQYADNTCFADLISNDIVWVIPKQVHAPLYVYGNDLSDDKGVFSDSEESTYDFLKYPNKRVADDATYEFLFSEKVIDDLVDSEIDEKITDCKIIMVPHTTILYLKGEKEEYGVKIYNSEIFEEEKSYLENFKVYTMSEIMSSLGSYERLPEEGVFDEKPTYEAESAALMEEGIIAGTDKGMEPLKPLSRIEATAILVRLLGLEDYATSETSYFTDIASDNWGAKYANIAYEKGIAAGVGDNQFAPDDIITSSQFVTLLMRSQNQDVDWQSAINIFVEKGLITEEQAEKMDLFTRGDMAKIVYEAKQAGII